MEMIFLALFFVFLVFGVPIGVVILLMGARAQVRLLSDRVSALERRVSGLSHRPPESEGRVATPQTVAGPPTKQTVAGPPTTPLTATKPTPREPARAATTPPAPSTPSTPSTPSRPSDLQATTRTRTHSRIAVGCFRVGRSRQVVAVRGEHRRACRGRRPLCRSGVSLRLCR